MRPFRGFRRLERAYVRQLGYPSDYIHFLHISKTAGSQIKRIIKDINSHRITQRVVAHDHDVRCADLPNDARYFFSIRDPISRFTSAFYWRKSKGAPHFNWEWSHFEELAFKNFEHANDLAEALFRDDTLGEKAAASIKSIGHTSRNQVDHFTLRGHVLNIQPPIWIIRQEMFETDILELLKRIGHNISPPIDEQAASARKQSYDEVVPLSSRGIENLRIWYAQDIQFVRQCHAWLASNGAKPHLPTERKYSKCQSS